MFAKFFTHKLRMELAELKHKHQLEINEIRANLATEERHWQEDRRRLTAQLKEEHEIKLKEIISLTKLDSDQRIKKAELDAEAKLNSTIAELNKVHYEKLQQSMTKLHEEGNVTTRYIQELSLKMFESAPKHKTETKVLTGTVSEK